MMAPAWATDAPKPTAEEAAAFVSDAEARLAELNVFDNRARWVHNNFITDDTAALRTKIATEFTTFQTDLAKQASRFDGVAVPFDVRRKLDLLKLTLVDTAPSDAKLAQQTTALGVEMSGRYGAAQYCPPGKTGTDCLDEDEISALLRTSTDPAESLAVWRGWHATAIPSRAKYVQYVALMNQGARELGYPNLGELWRSKYEMPAKDFTAEVDRLWNQVKPLYDPLHCYVRWKLTEKYGQDVVRPGEPIPAHLLRNIWAQEWGNLYDLVAPATTTPRYDLTKILAEHPEIDEREMVRIGERFFTSIGFQPLPQTFWDRSLFTRPRDRNVVCYASATDVDDFEDVRLKMCIQKTEDDFNTIHHELGHDFNRLAYRNQPYLYKSSAHDGFDEAVGDTIGLSVTPGYLKKIGLIQNEPPASADIALLLRDALDKVALLPFSVAMEAWRGGVFSGEISPENYNRAWWDLRRKYQGIQPVGMRGEEFFDAGAKYHIVANVPYTRYFLARILQFQLHRALCKTAGYQGPLNRCSIYGNKEAGAKLENLLKLGQSRPWPEALEAATGQRQMDASAIVDYFQPLVEWLNVQNRGKQCGWK